MEKKFRLGTTVLPLICAIGMTLAVNAQEAAKENAPAVIAVKFHADWCGYCKAMGSVFEELQAKFDTLPVLYVVLDHTREFNRRQSAFLAHSLGLEKVWAEYGGKTGFVLLIDGSTREVITKLTHELNLKQMGAALTEAVEKVAAKR